MTDISAAVFWQPAGETKPKRRKGEPVRAWGIDRKGYLVAVRTDSGVYATRT